MGKTIQIPRIRGIRPNITFVRCAISEISLLLESDRGVDLRAATSRFVSIDAPMIYPVAAVSKTRCTPLLRGGGGHSRAFRARVSAPRRRTPTKISGRIIRRMLDRSGPADYEGGRKYRVLDVDTWRARNDQFIRGRVTLLCRCPC